MESLCPNCQKLISVPDQYAGQTMKCPLCQQNFQAPTLPSSAPAPATFTPPPPVDLYKLTPEPAAATPTAGGAFAPSLISESAKSKTAASAPSPPPPPPPSGYARKFSLQLSSQVLVWIPAASFVLIFFLTFFSWVGLYPGGVDVYSQNAWQVIWGGPSELDAVFEKEVFKDHFSRDFDSKKDAPGWSIASVFYILSFLAVLLVVVAITAVSQLKIQVPPVVQPIWVWRNLALCVFSLAPLFFLGVQGVVGYPLEDKARLLVHDRFESLQGDKTENGKKKVAIMEGMGESSLCVRRTLARSLAVLLHLLASVAAAMSFWLERRGPGRPMPRAEILW